MAFMKTPAWPLARPGTVAAMKKATKFLERHGVTLDEVPCPSEIIDWDSLKRMHSVVISTDAQAAYLKEYQTDKKKLHPEICSIVENSKNYTSKDRHEALDRYARRVLSLTTLPRTTLLLLRLARS